MELRVLLLLALLQRWVLHQMMQCHQCGASPMLLNASVVERGYLAHCGADMAQAFCHPR